MSVRSGIHVFRDNWGVICGATLLALLTGLSVNFLPPGYVAVFSVPLAVYVVLLWPSSLNLTGQRINYVFFCYLIVFGAWPQFSSYKVPGLPALEPQRILYAAVVLTALTFFIIGKSVRGSVLSVLASDAKIPAILIAALFTIHAIVGVFGNNPVYSVFLVVREFLTTAALFYAALIFIKSESDIQRSYTAITFSALMVSLIALLESVLKKNLFASWVPLSNNYAMWATAERIRDGQYRVQATFDNPLLLVDYLVFVLPIALYGAIYRKGIMRWMSVATLFIIPLALIRTGSRSAYLALAVQFGLVLFILLLRRIVFFKRAYFALLSLLVVILVPLLMLPFLGDLMAMRSGNSAEEAMSTSARVSMVRNAVDNVMSGNVFGVGFGGAPEAIGVRNMMGSTWAYVLDNYFVTLAMDSGLIALLLFSGLCGWALYKSLTGALKLPGQAGALSASIFVCVAGFLLIKTISSQTQVFPMFYAALVFCVIVNRNRNLDHDQARYS